MSDAILMRRDGKGRVPQTQQAPPTPIPRRTGFNTIFNCRWCGNKSKEVYIEKLSQGKDGKPYSIVFNYEPCDACKAKWQNMVIIIETLKFEPYPDCLPLTDQNAPEKLYPTGRHVGITEELAKEAIDKNAKLGMVFFLDCAMFDKAFGNIFENNNA